MALQASETVKVGIVRVQHGAVLDAQSCDVGVCGSIAKFVDITEKLASHARQFLIDVEAGNSLRPVKRSSLFAQLSER